MTKLIKGVKYYSYSERLEKLELTTLQERKMRGDLIETFKIMEFLIMVDVFLVFHLKLEIYGYHRK